MNNRVKEQYELWCCDEYFDICTRNELIAIAGNEKEIEDRFYKDLEFGTGGLRGILGAGTNRMNVYTVRKATQGVANYILKQKGERKGVAIAYDSRKWSQVFAEEVALCFNANGIVTFKFESLRPTPELSFAVRELGCVAGVVITASHNPKMYNGYKVYWEDGAQITAPKDREIINEVDKIKDYSCVKTMDRETAQVHGLYNLLGEGIDNKFISELKKQGINADTFGVDDIQLNVVYTPLHGTGNLLVRKILSEIGVENVFVVPEQEEPDGEFPTVKYPNPEDPNSFELALNYARKQEADIVLATDPDADRLGLYVRDEKDDYVPFTGNMTGVLICDYILSQKKTKGILPDNGAVVSTIVTSKMAQAIADKYGVKFIETLTGFKYIGEQIKEFENSYTYQFLFGLEESYGCLIGTYARDKDAVGAAMMVCEMAAYYKQQKKTLWQRMKELYEEYGYYKEELLTVTMEGIEGAHKIKNIVEAYRENPPAYIGGFRVNCIRDYKKGYAVSISMQNSYKLDLPTSNVIYFELEEGGWVCIRPSGTEPKIKYYYGVIGVSLDDAIDRLKRIRTDLEKND